MCQDINSILFKRIKPAKKLSLIDSLSKSELLAISPETIKRMVKEVGRKIGRTRGKYLYISREFRTGNSWNSEVEGIGYNSKGLFLYLYVQFSNSDRTIVETWNKFFWEGRYVGSLEYTDKYGGTQTSHFIYDDSDKARCMRRFLMQYLYLKYKDKLMENEAA